jgi:hypothetical protein
MVEVVFAIRKKNFVVNPIAPQKVGRFMSEGSLHPLLSCAIFNSLEEVKLCALKCRPG